MKKQICLAAALMVLSMAPLAVAHADNMDVRPYMGVGMGAFGLEYRDSAISQNNTGFGGFVKGGADIGDYFGLELRLGTTSKVSTNYVAGTLGAAAGKFETSAGYFLSYLGKLQIPASDELRPYALFGGTTASFKSSNSSSGLSSSKAKTGFSYGFGLDYNLGNQFSVNAEWMQYWSDVKLGSGYAAAPTGATDSKARIWGVVAAVDYHF